MSTLTGHDFSSHKSTLILVTPASSPYYQAFTTTTKRKERLKHVLDHVQETPRVELRTTRLLVFFTEPLFIYLYMCVGVCGGDVFFYILTCTKCPYKDRNIYDSIDLVQTFGWSKEKLQLLFKNWGGKCCFFVTEVKIVVRVKCSTTLNG